MSEWKIIKKDWLFLEANIVGKEINNKIMPYIILLPIIIVLVVVILRTRKRIKELERKLGSDASPFTKASEDKSASGFEEYNQKMREQREGSKNKILELLKEKNEINNNDVEKALGIGDSTATKYLQELENEGKIIQKFETGRGVVYTLK